MEPTTFTLEIVAVDELQIDCLLRSGSVENGLCYRPFNGAVSFAEENSLSSVIQNNLHQLEKILRSAVDGTLRVGQIISCVLIDNFFFLQASHFNQFIRVNWRQGGLAIQVREQGLHRIHKIYADGSCQLETRNAGYGGFTQAPDGRRQTFFKSFSAGSNNLMELLAVIEGLQRCTDHDPIQVNTDSRFVIRGLAQWVHFWRHNGWQTAYGREVRYREQWQQAYHLTAGKLVELHWIKGHSGNDDQDYCHQLAKSAAVDFLP